MAKEFINEGGINGIGDTKIDTSHRDFKILQEKIKARANSFSQEERLAHQFLSVRIQMESYLRSENTSEKKLIGDYLKILFGFLGIKNKELAEFIGLKESNFSAIINGKRKLNSDLAIKLGKIFSVDPILLLQIQNKNEVLEIKEQNSNIYNEFNLTNLLKHAG